VDLERLAALTAGCSGADLSALCNEAAIRTVRRQGEELEAGDFEDALRTFYSARGISLQNLGEVAAGYLGLQK
jgi:ATP-dependent Zn protease